MEKGTSRPLEIFELLGEVEEGPLSDSQNQLTIEFSEGLQAFYNRDFKLASSTFKKLWTAFDDIPSRIFLRRAKEYMIDAPDDSWNGEIKLFQ